jgi:hypothetical protein
MTSNDDLLVGVITLALVPLIALRIVRGVRTGRLPLYRTHVERDEDRGKFTALLALHAVSLLLVATISADLLLGLNLRSH